MELYILYIVYRYGINRTYMMCVFAQSCRTLCGPLDSSTLRTRQAPLSMGFPRQEYWSELPFPTSGTLPKPGVKPGSPALQVDSLQTAPLGKPIVLRATTRKNIYIERDTIKHEMEYRKVIHC